MRVLVTQHIPEAGLAMLRENQIETDILPRGKNRKKDILKALGAVEYQGMLCLLTDAIDEEIIDAASGNVSIIANYAVGFNNIDAVYAKSRGITVTNTPGVLTDSVAEFALTLMLTVAKRVVEADKFTRQGKFSGWEPELFLGVDVLGKKLGIIGAGRIGTRLARLGKGVGMEIIYHDMGRNEELEKDLGAKMCQAPEDLLREADIVSLHLPLNQNTHHFLDRKKISLMKTGALLINTSRGAVVDEEALARALENKKIFGAGLDVFEYEPKISKRLCSLPNVVLTPHIASATIATRNQMAKMAAQNIVAVLSGGTAPNQVI